MASFRASAVDAWRDERIGEETTVGFVAAREMRSVEAWREIMGWVSPRRTRLIEVGE